MDTCKQLQQTLIDLQSVEQLDRDQQEHLNSCSDCQEFCSNLEQIDNALGQLPEIDASDDLVARTLAAIEKEIATESEIESSSPLTKKHTPAMRPWANGLAASLVIFSLSCLLIQGQLQMPTGLLPEPNTKPDSDFIGVSSSNFYDITEIFIANPSDLAADTALIAEYRAIEQTTALGTERQAKATRMSYNFDASYMDALSASQPEEVGALMEEIEVIDIGGSFKKALDMNRFSNDESDAINGADFMPPQETIEGELVDTIGITNIRGTFKAELEPRSPALRSKPPMNNNTDVLIRTESKHSFQYRQQPAAAKPNFRARRDISKAKESHTAEKSDAVTVNAQSRSAGFNLYDTQPINPLASLQIAQKYLATSSSLEGLNYRQSSGYWANTYLPGDPEMRWLGMELQQSNLDTEFSQLLGKINRNTQPFDPPSSSALALYLQADKKAIEGQTRLKLQVGIQASERQSGQRADMNMAVVINLASIDKSQQQAKVRALLASLLTAKQPGDKFLLKIITTTKIFTLLPEEFRHGHIQVLLDQLFSSTGDTTMSEPRQMQLLNGLKQAKTMVAGYR